MRSPKGRNRADRSTRGTRARAESAAVFKDAKVVVAQPDGMAPPEDLLEVLDLVNVIRAAELLGITHPSVYKAIAAGRVTVVTIEGGEGKIKHAIRRSDLPALRDALVARLRDRGHEDKARALERRKIDGVDNDR